MRPISYDQIPPALTTSSQRTGPRSVTTSLTRPRATPIESTFTPVWMVTPRWRAPSASALASDAGSIRPSVGK